MVVFMFRRLLIIPIVLFVCSANGQEYDSLFAVKKDGKMAIEYVFGQRENPSMLSKRFYVEELNLENINTDDVLKKHEEGMTIYVPILKENYITEKPAPLSMRNVHEFYYKVGPRDEISILGNYSGVPKSQIRQWNDLKGNTLYPDQVLFMGWIKMMDRDSTNPITYTAYPPPKRRLIIDTPSNVLGGLDSVYNIQTNNGLNVLTEKGTAVFFPKPGKDLMYYAFHNEAARGSIIKVFNPGTGKIIYAKVLGPLPDTKLYANCIIGICSGAKEELGITDNKTWCELYYAAD